MIEQGHVGDGVGGVDELQARVRLYQLHHLLCGSLQIREGGDFDRYVQGCGSGSVLFLDFKATIRHTEHFVFKIGPKVA
jgi:hypothetical protein